MRYSDLNLELNLSFFFYLNHIIHTTLRNCSRDSPKNSHLSLNYLYVSRCNRLTQCLLQVKFSDPNADLNIRFSMKHTYDIAFVIEQIAPGKRSNSEPKPEYVSRETSFKIINTDIPECHNSRVNAQACYLPSSSSVPSESSAWTSRCLPLPASWCSPSPQKRIECQVSWASPKILPCRRCTRTDPDQFIFRRIHARISFLMVEQLTSSSS